MENMDSLVGLFTNTSMTIVIVAYFIYRDYKFMGKLSEALATVINTTETLHDLVKNQNNGLDKIADRITEFYKSRGSEHEDK